MKAYRVARIGIGPNSRRWNIVDRRGVIVEGGFFNRERALDACEVWNAAREGKACPDCGALGERVGHQTCAYPQDH